MTNKETLQSQTKEEMLDRSNVATSLISDTSGLDCWAVMKLKSDEPPPTTDSLAVTHTAKLDFGNHWGSPRLQHYITIAQQSLLMCFIALYIMLRDIVLFV